jgi:prephenate dehydrogenase
MLISIIGLGLIGGSFAKATTARTNHTVAGYNRTKSVLEEALRCGAIHKIVDSKTLNESDLVILGLYPELSAKYVKEHAAEFGKNTVVIDTSGTKTKICAELQGVAEEYGFTFIGCHPMAGKEKGGFKNADESLYCGASFIMATTEQNEKTAMVEQYAKDLGFSMIKRTTPAEHDSMIAFTSQLPHVLACAYILDKDAPNHKGFSAGSYHDVSRVARINAPLWDELFIENKDFLIPHIDSLIENLQLLRGAIEASDHQKLTELLTIAGETKKRID